MNVIYSDKAKKSGREFTLPQQAMKRLEETISASAKRLEEVFDDEEPVSVEWDRGTDERGRVR